MGEQKSDEIGCNLLIDTLTDSPSIITEITGIEPTEILLKGANRISPSTKKALPALNKENLWILKSEKIIREEGMYLNHAIEVLLKILYSKEKEFKFVFNKYQNNHLSCYTNSYTYHQYFHLDKELIKSLYEFGLIVEFDTYYYTTVANL